MQISFNKVVPSYLEKEKVNSSQVWGNDFLLEKGKYFQVIAPSGRGKSSLTHFIYGLRKDYDGEISIAGVNVKKSDAENLSLLRQQTVSIIFQDLRLFNDHTVEQNLLVKKELLPYQNASSISEMTSRLGIQNKLHQKAGLCSYGEQQRVSIIRALLQPFDFLVMDEPFSHLDIDNRHRALELILEEAGKRNAGILLLDLQENDHFKNSVKIQL